MPKGVTARVRRAAARWPAGPAPPALSPRRRGAASARWTGRPGRRPSCLRRRHLWCRARAEQPDCLFLAAGAHAVAAARRPGKGHASSRVSRIAGCSNCPQENLLRCRQVLWRLWVFPPGCLGGNTMIAVMAGRCRVPRQGGSGSVRFEARWPVGGDSRCCRRPCAPRRSGWTEFGVTRRWTT